MSVYYPVARDRAIYERALRDWWPNRHKVGERVGVRMMVNALRGMTNRPIKRARCTV